MRAAYLAALFAIVGFLTAPAGFMPARAADGGLVLQICPSTTPAARALMLHEAKAQSAHHAHHGHSAHNAHAAETSHAMHDASEQEGATGHHGGDGHASGSDSPCDYAVAGPAALPDQSDLSDRPSMIAVRAYTPRTPITGIFSEGLPPSTGPPIS